MTQSSDRPWDLAACSDPEGSGPAEQTPAAGRGLAARDCVPCRGGVPPLTSAQIAPLLAQLSGWQVVDNHHLQKRYQLKDFADALELVNRIGAIAEEQGHHPDMVLAWGKVEVQIWTHKINGLTESDFILAAKCDAAAADMGVSGSVPRR